MSKTPCILHAITSSSKMSLDTYLSNGDGTFKYVASKYDTVSTSIKMFSMDVDGDGLSDVLQVYINNSTLSFNTYLSQSNGIFSPVSTNYTGYPTSYIDMFPMDINGDGKQDVLQAWNNKGYMNFVSYLSQGDGTFKPIASSSTQTYVIVKLLSMDINADGKQDLLQVISSPSSLLEFISYLSQGDGTFTTVNSYYSTSTSNYYILPLDVNGDNKMDVLQMSYLGSAPRLIGMTSYLSNGDGSFKLTYDDYPDNNDALPYLNNNKAIFPMSITKDGKSGVLEDGKDITSVSPYVYYFSSYVSQEDGTFILVNKTYVPHSTEAVIVIDTNGDDLTDVVHATMSASGGGMQFYSYMAQGNGLYDDPIASSYPGVHCTGSCIIFPMESC